MNALQLDKALRDLVAQMRSPSPEAGTDHQSDSHQASPPSNLTSPISKPSKAAEAAKGISLRRGRIATTIRADPSTAPDANFGSTSAHAPSIPGLSLKQTRNAAVETDSSSRLTIAAQAEHASAAVSGVSEIQQSRSRQDAAQQTVSSPVENFLQGHDTSVESELPILPTDKRQVAKAVPTDERSTQTPIGHASPRPFQRLPPGRSSDWPSSHIAQAFDVSSPGLMHRQLLRHEAERATHSTVTPSGNGPERPDPSRQWADVPPKAVVTGESQSAYRDLAGAYPPDLPVSPAIDQQNAPKCRSESLQKLFSSPVPYVDWNQLVMQTRNSFPAEQRSLLDDQGSSQMKLHRPEQMPIAESSPLQAPGVSSSQDFAHQPTAVCSNPAKRPFPAALAAHNSLLMQHAATAAALTNRDVSHALDMPASPWPRKPSATPGLAGPSLPSGEAFVPSQMPSHAPYHMPTEAQLTVPSQMPSRMPPYMPSQMPSRMPSYMPSHVPSHVPIPHQHQPQGISYANWQSPPFLPAAARQAAPYAWRPSSGFEEEQGSAGRGPAALMQRQQGLAAIHQQPQHMYPGLAQSQILWFPCHMNRTITTSCNVGSSCTFEIVASTS